MTCGRPPTKAEADNARLRAALTAAVEAMRDAGVDGLIWQVHSEFCCGPTCPCEDEVGVWDAAITAAEAALSGSSEQQP